MDAATATVIAALIGAGASIVVALISSRVPTGGHQASSEGTPENSQPASSINERRLPESVPRFHVTLPRVFGTSALWLLYIVTVFIFCVFLLNVLEEWKWRHVVGRTVDYFGALRLVSWG